MCSKAHGMWVNAAITWLLCPCTGHGWQLPGLQSKKLPAVLDSFLSLAWGMEASVMK